MTNQPVQHPLPLQELAESNLRSNTRGIYQADNDDKWVAGHSEIQQIAERIESRIVRTVIFVIR